MGFRFLGFYPALEFRIAACGSKILGFGPSLGFSIRD